MMASRIILLLLSIVALASLADCARPAARPPLPYAARLPTRHADPDAAAKQEAATAAAPASQNEALAALRRWMRGTLLDPDAAHITVDHWQRGIVAMSGGTIGGVFLCGRMNAKNLYGGYTGYHPFIAAFSHDDASRIVGVQSGAEEAGMDIIIELNCAGLRTGRYAK